MSPLAFLWVFPTYLNKGEEGETRGSQWKMNTRGTSLLSKGTETIFALRSGKKETGPKKRKPTTPPPGIAHPPAARDPCRPIQRVSWPRQKKARQASPPANRPVQSIPVCNLRVGWLGGGSRTCRNPPFRAIAHSHTLPSGLTLHSRGCCWFFLQFGPFKSCR